MHKNAFKENQPILDTIPKALVGLFIDLAGPVVAQLSQS